MSLITPFSPSLARPSARCGHAERADIAAAEKPHYEIKETDAAFTVAVHLPGVAKDGLELTAEDGRFRVVGRRAWKQPEGWTALHRESVEAPFELVLTHDHAIDAGKVSAELRDGVLRATLPKAEAAKPRRIAVN